jgi:hypothetical protein
MNASQVKPSVIRNQKPLLWVWPAAALIYSLIAVSYWRHQSMIYNTVVQDIARRDIATASQTIRELQNILFGLPLFTAILLGLATCASWRWPSLPTKLAASFLFITYVFFSLASPL